MNPEIPTDDGHLIVDLCLVTIDCRLLVTGHSLASEY